MLKPGGVFDVGFEAEREWILWPCRWEREPNEFRPRSHMVYRLPNGHRHAWFTDGAPFPKSPTAPAVKAIGHWALKAIATRLCLLRAWDEDHCTEVHSLPQLHKLRIGRRLFGLEPQVTMGMRPKISFSQKAKSEQFGGPKW